MNRNEWVAKLKDGTAWGKSNRATIMIKQLDEIFVATIVDDFGRVSHIEADISDLGEFLTTIPNIAASHAGASIVLGIERAAQGTVNPPKGPPIGPNGKPVILQAAAIELHYQVQAVNEIANRVVNETANREG
jgi:hypothetical protein